MSFRVRTPICARRGIGREFLRGCHILFNGFLSIVVLGRSSLVSGPPKPYWGGYKRLQLASASFKRYLRPRPTSTTPRYSNRPQPQPSLTQASMWRRPTPSRLLLRSSYNLNKPEHQAQASPSDADVLDVLAPNRRPGHRQHTHISAFFSICGHLPHGISGTAPVSVPSSSIFALIPYLFNKHPHHPGRTRLRHHHVWMNSDRVFRCPYWKTASRTGLAIQWRVEKETVPL